jgi:hypothetical protein
MTESIDLTSFTPAAAIEGDSTDDTALLRTMAIAAEDYVRSFRWCPRIDEYFLAYGVGGVIALFLFRFAERVSGTDECLWVVVGDVPSAYFVIGNRQTARAALTVYCELMEDWCNAVRLGTSLAEVFPVAADATTERANMLMSRVRFIRENVLLNCP